jgi:hypothetical protein
VSFECVRVDACNVCVFVWCVCVCVCVCVFVRVCVRARARERGSVYTHKDTHTHTHTHTHTQEVSYLDVDHLPHSDERRQGCHPAFRFVEPCKWLLFGV